MTSADDDDKGRTEIAAVTERLRETMGSRGGPWSLLRSCWWGGEVVSWRKVYKRREEENSAEDHRRGGRTTLATHWQGRIQRPPERKPQSHSLTTCIHVCSMYMYM